MDAIYIPQLTKAPEHTEEIEVKEFLPGLETLTPIRGHIRVQHCGNYLEVSAQVEAIVTLTCYRCLQQYNHRLRVAPKEVIWLDAKANFVDDLPLEREVLMDDLVESLPPDGYFSPGEWLYEQMCLEIPQRQLCNSKCEGIDLNAVESDSPSTSTAQDKRWASLEALKNKLSS
ncbi:MAG: DUF177 domain-containing protein [Scytonematopsis contorta HA4267-MV1]|jgi:uncharacterized protein|nr:DUF177 domain-containing protein [Scytonematopsis contorta HA4267-MV1]